MKFLIPLAIALLGAALLINTKEMNASDKGQAASVRQTAKTGTQQSRSDKAREQARSISGGDFQIQALTPSEKIELEIATEQARAMAARKLELQKIWKK